MNLSHITAWATLAGVFVAIAAMGGGAALACRKTTTPGQTKAIGALVGGALLTALAGGVVAALCGQVFVAVVLLGDAALTVFLLPLQRRTPAPAETAKATSA